MCPCLLIAACSMITQFQQVLLVQSCLIWPAHSSLDSLQHAHLVFCIKESCELIQEKHLENDQPVSAKQRQRHANMVWKHRFLE